MAARPLHRAKLSRAERQISRSRSPLLLLASVRIGLLQDLPGSATSRTWNRRCRGVNTPICSGRRWTLLSGLGRLHTRRPHGVWARGQPGAWPGRSGFARGYARRKRPTCRPRPEPRRLPQVWTGRNPCSRRDVPLTGALSAGRQASPWLTTSRGAWSGVNKITWSSSMRALIRTHCAAARCAVRHVSSLDGAGCGAGRAGRAGGGPAEGAAIRIAILLAAGRRLVAKH
jgi:hypothetical protein